MGNSKGKFESILESILFSKEMTHATCEMMFCAAEIDRLRAQIARDSRRAAESFTRVAADIEEGRMIGEAPWSSLFADIAAMTPKLYARTECFLSMLQIYGGPEMVRRFQAARKAVGE